MDPAEIETAALEACVESGLPRSACGAIAGQATVLLSIATLLVDGFENGAYRTAFAASVTLTQALAGLRRLVGSEQALRSFMERLAAKLNLEPDFFSHVENICRRIEEFGGHTRRNVTLSPLPM